MAEITAALVKELREKTGAGMMDCKRALGETGGDIEAAVDWLRKKGLAAAAKKAGRVAAEGLIGVADARAPRAPSSRSMPRPTSSPATSCSRSFVRARRAARARRRRRPRDAEAGAPIPGPAARVDEELTAADRDDRREHGAAPGRRGCRGRQGVVATYVHNAVAPGLGKIGVLVALESDRPSRRSSPALGRQLAMHVAAANPQASRHRRRSTRRRSSASATCCASRRAPAGKPEAIIEKMVEGRLRKFYEEVVLLEQVFVIDGENRVSKVVEAAAQGGRRADQGRRLRPLRAGRGHREGDDRLRRRGGGSAEELSARLTREHPAAIAAAARALGLRC